LRKAERAAAKTGVELSEWEGEFLTGVAERVKTYGRAFGDPDKGSPGQALSMLQAAKLRQITAKAKGEDKAKGGNKDKSASRFGHNRRARPEPSEPSEDED
jgi:hypothetical protein